MFSSIIDFLFWIPLWLLALILNVWLMAVALGGIWTVRRYVLPRLRLGYDDAYYAAAVVQSAMLLYGLIAALTAVGVWQRYSQVSDTVSAEATAIVSLWRELGGYPDPVKTTSQDLLRGYTEQIIRDAWPQQRRGQIPIEGVQWMNRLQVQIFSFEPATEAQKILHAETLRSFNQLVQKRRQRLDSVHSALPTVMWVVLLPGAMGCIVLCLFFHVENAYFQAIPLVGLAGFLAMVLFVIIALDRPFVGDMGITAESYALIFEHHMK
jgi:Protein of unknown function (DUF4239)